VPIVVGALALHSAVLAAQQAPALRTLASFRESGVTDMSTSPNGRFILQATPTNLRMYEVASRQSWDLAEGSAQALRWSPRGDMVAFARAGDGESGDHVWAMPVDATTGRARGLAQRVTVGRVDTNTGGVSIQISVDGRWIAFAGVDSGQANNLSIVPATGGPERVLGRFPRGLFLFEWSLDGRTIYVNGPAPEGTMWNILKVRVDGGATEVIRSRREVLAGMTADRRYLVLLPRKSPLAMAAGDQGTVIDTTGREVGHFALPVGPPMFDRVLGDSALVWWTEADHMMLEMRPVAGGSARRLPLIGESNDVPLWSPDGNRIAFRVRDGGRTSLAVMNADGTNPRVFRETDVPANTWGVCYWWSPDSRFVAFLSPDRRRLSLLDVVAGTNRTVLEDTASVFSYGQWRADGQAIYLVSTRHGIVPLGGRVEEVAVNGQRRQVLEWPIVNPTTGFEFVGGSSAFVRSDSAAFLRPLGTGPIRRLAGVPSGTQLINAVVSDDLRWIGGLLVDRGRPESNQVEVFSIETSARTVLDLPFEMNPWRYPAEFLPGENALLVFGHPSGETDIKLYRVPLNGDAPRVFAEVGKSRQEAGVTTVSASPDGRSVVYSVQPEPSTGSFILVDLRGAVPRATSRSPRR
jgi:Tol biopolymer transport system component